MPKTFSSAGAFVARAARPNKTVGIAAVAAGLLVGAALATSPALAKDPVTVMLDRAKVMRIDKPASTVIVGNPAIADAVMHDRNTLVIVGRGFGSTNLIILDENGQPIADETLVVQPPETALVTVQRRTARYSYSCSPTCAPAVNPGDEEKFFGASTSQVASRNSAAQQAATGKGE